MPRRVFERVGTFYSSLEKEQHRTRIEETEAKGSEKFYRRERMEATDSEIGR